MIGIGLKVEVKKSKVLTDTQKRLALPLLEATQFITAKILERIQRGQGPRGPWNSYAAGADKSADLFWVAPDRPQPGDPDKKEGLRFRVTTGEWVGWAAYDSPAAYYRLRGLSGRPHTFTETGELLRALAARVMNPRHIRVAFYGSHGNTTAKQIAALASRGESDPLLMPSQAEVEAFEQFCVGRLNEAIIEGARYGAESQRLSSRSRAVTKKVRKLLAD